MERRGGEMGGKLNLRFRGGGGGGGGKGEERSWG